MQHKRIAYADFARQLEAEILKRKKSAASVHQTLLRKIAAILKARDTSFFEFFVMLDVNQSGAVSRLEFKTGIQQLGLNTTPSEFKSLWGAVYQPVNRMQHEDVEQQSAGAGRGQQQPKRSDKRGRLEPPVEEVDFLSVLSAFSEAGCLKLQTALDHRDALLGKFRAQLKKSRTSVEKAYKTFDPTNHGNVQTKDFLRGCQDPALGLQFADEELIKLFECICEQGTKKTTSND